MVRFTTKKINTLTLGEKIKKIRNERRMSIADISKGTKIQSKYLEFLEEGEYMKLPADVYVRGFLRSYALFVGLDEKSLLKQYEREKGIHKSIKKISDNNENIKPLKFSSFIITPKIITLIFVSIIVLGSFIYLYNEVNNFVSFPRLVILSPSDGSSVEGNSIHLVGVAEKDALVFINDQPTLVNEKGEFSQDIVLKNGLNNIIIRAMNKFNKESKKAIAINADFKEEVREEMEINN